MPTTNRSPPPKTLPNQPASAGAGLGFAGVRFGIRRTANPESDVQDDQFTYLYDAEGNLVQRNSKFTAITIDDLDTSRVYTSSTNGFESQDGDFPLTDSNPQQQYSSGGLLGAGTALAEVTFPEVSERLYDVWTTWQQRDSRGSGKYEMFVKDDYTRANIPLGLGLGMLQDQATRIFSRTNDSSQNTDIPTIGNVLCI